ncbi:helix-hairpin-helix domain-containing protein [Crassaminicella profunda]|uniref:helix-hairpin-helix domain-containing protein n=1 Tax=Crassaminicella profunda TaxID=1286698 RepID=UPI001CA60AE6|nr:helix-hairpin-helix domain-containing protein [Crassaminicella profunda]QZY57072.1 helix-hairpin-helix domain-containing protein [Crassaminicella profunda]
MFKLTKREIAILGIFILTIIVFVADKLYINESKEIVVEHDNKKIEEMEKIQEKKDLEEEKFVIVDICGEVKRSGIVKLKEGARLIDGVKIAGGLLETADRKQINMAKVLIDGEQIVIPKIGENPINNSNVASNNMITHSNRVNINTGSKSELESLNGIGKVLAERIIQYRETNGGFTSIQDIMKVSGLGDKKYEMIKEQIRVN